MGIFSTKPPEIKGCVAEIKLSKPDFVVGEVVHGSVFLTLQDAIGIDDMPLSAIDVKFESVERAKWRNSSGDANYDYDVHKELFSYVIPIQLPSPCPLTLPAGSHAFPIVFQLAPNLTRSFQTYKKWLMSEVEDLTANLEYAVCLTVRSKGAEMTAREMFNVHSFAIPVQENL